VNHSKRRREAKAAERAGRRVQMALDELDFDTVEELGLDGTGRDGDPRFPYTTQLLNRQQRRHPQKSTRS
jgi:hypothetical protein